MRPKKALRGLFFFSRPDALRFFGGTRKMCEKKEKIRLQKAVACVILKTAVRQYEE